MNFDGAGSDEVRRFFLDNALMWLRDYHADALRIDAIHAIYDASAVHFLEQLAQEVSELEAHLGRRLTLIAESDLNDPRVVTPRECGGFGIDAQWSDDFHHALHTVLTGERNGYYADFGKMEHLAKALRQAFVYDGIESEHRGRRHGGSRWGSMDGALSDSLQNHDQVGNRARGERSSALMSVERAKIGAALVMCAPFVPMLFQGEEFGASAPFLYFTDYDDPELGRLIFEGRKKEFVAFGWSPEQIPDPQSEETFTRSRLNWSELRDKPHASLLQWHKDLIALRRSRSELSDGNLNAVQVRFDENAQWLVLERGALRIACNLGREPVEVKIGSGAQVLLASDDSIRLSGTNINLAADSVAVLQVASQAF